MAKSYESIIQSRIDNYMNEPFGITQFLFEKQMLDEIGKKINSLDKNIPHAVEFNQGPNEMQRKYIKYMIENHNCSYGFINYHSYIFYIPNAEMQSYYNKFFEDWTDKFVETNFPKV